jgi:hypothetical protein
MNSTCLMGALVSAGMLGCASQADRPSTATTVAASTQPAAVEQVATYVGGEPVAAVGGGTGGAYEIVCERVATVGTRLTRRVCTTRAQREQERQIGRDFTEIIQRRALMHVE